MSSSRGYRYAPVDGDHGAHRTPASHPPWWRIHAIYGVVIFIVAVISFYSGQDRSPSDDSMLRRLNLRLVPYTFEYNRTYAERPSQEVDDAWADIFPVHGGFFQHPTIAPQRSAIAAFHQLHCLNEIREGVYAMEEGDVKDDRSTTKHTHDHGSYLPHIRHCIDLLRQSLMCQPDLTVEVKDEELGGVTGFGTEHQCVDWPQLLDWMKQYERNGAPEPSEPEKHRHHDEDGHGGHGNGNGKAGTAGQ